MAFKRLRSTGRLPRSPADAVSAVLRSQPICIDRRDFLRMSAATGFMSVLGCGRTPEPGTAPASTPSTEPESNTSSAPAPAPAPAPAANSIADTAAALDKNLERIFRFVQEEVRYEPYPGVLRGSASTLAGRAGNSADQAVLLAALLTASDIPHRFAIGPLVDAKVRELDAASVADFAAARSSSVNALHADARILRTHTDAMNASAAPNPVANPGRFAIPASAIRQTVTRQFESAIDTIQSALSNAKIAVTSAWSGIPKLERERHVWVQARSGSEWIDLDPSFPGTLIASVHATVRSTADALPDDMRHRVEFIATAETWKGGKLTTTPILEFSAFADALAGVPVGFTNVKSDDLKGLNLAGLMGGGGAMKYNAVLEVGTRLYIGETAIKFGGGGGGGAGGDGGTFVDAFGGGGESAGLPEGEATAEWLEVRLTSPDGESRSAMRTIFDRISEQAGGDVAQEVGAVPPVEIIELPTGSREFLPCRTVHAFSIAGGTSSMLSLALPPAESALGSLSWSPQAYHFVRDLLTAEIALQHGVRVFLDSPCVASFTIESVAGTTELHTVASFDLWHRSFGVLAVADRKPAYPPQMIAGVLSHVAERCVSREGYGARPASAGPPTSVGAVFEQIGAQGLRVRALRGDLPDVSPYSQEARSHFMPYLQAGIVVIIPERYPENQSRIGWWLVDPANGRTRDRMDDGRGNAQAEYTSTTAAVIRVTGCIIALVSLLSSVYQYVAKRVSVMSEEEDEFWDRVGLTTEVVGFFSGAGCISDKIFLRAKPRPRPDRALRKVPGGWIEM